MTPAYLPNLYHIIIERNKSDTTYATAWDSYSIQVKNYNYDL